jgi:ABC-type thiamine transport system substrate-binding protein
LTNTIVKTSNLVDSFNITSGANNIVSTNASANLRLTVSVGDIVTVGTLTKRLSGTGNTTSGSNTVIGVNTNFLNELQDGDIVYLSTGNTETVTVTGNTSFYTQNTIGVSNTGVLINLVFSDTKTVTFVNANTILVDTNFSTNASYANVSLQKVS